LTQIKVGLGPIGDVYGERVRRFPAKRGSGSPRMARDSRCAQASRRMAMEDEATAVNEALIAVEPERASGPDGGKSSSMAVRRSGTSSEPAAIASRSPPSGERPWNANALQDLLPIDSSEIARALGTLAAQAMMDPVHAMAATANLAARFWQGAAETWWLTAARAWGLAPLPAVVPKAPVADRRFEAPEWEQNPFFRLLRLSYLAIAEQLLAEAERVPLDRAERLRLVFHLRQLVDAANPTLFLATNPAALRKAWSTGGASVIDGLRNFLADLRAGHLSITDTEAFSPGKNLALTPGEVVYRNRLIELIEYVPLGPTSYAVPLLVIPPWINKFYVLDLQPKNSLVRFLLARGFSVFMISWKNPDASMEDISFEDYMVEGALAASDVARAITGAERVNPVGYCIGGTLLAAVLGCLAARGDERFGPATFMVSLVDFADVGDTAVFIDEPQVAYMERRMLERGYLDSRDMSKMFNLLRANDLIWNTVINNYLLGNRPAAFDLLYWNSDGTRMAREAHSFYLRNTYLENNLIKPGKLSLLGQPLDLRRIRQDIYAVGAARDHIVPWRAAWRIAQLTSAKTRFVLAASGHIAGMINPPVAGKGYWANDASSAPATAEQWLAGARRHDGSWWSDWVMWLETRSGEKRPSPPLGSATHPPLCDAPGTYVLEK
jgi:polyhydroxyalkanoate synthase